MTQSPAQIYFTVSLANPGSDMLILEIERLRQAVRLTRAQRRFQIDAWVVMPDHLHAIWTLPVGDDDAAGRWRQIKARFSASLSRSADRPRFPPPSVWRPGLWQHRIADPADLTLHLRSCQMDPVRHGLVDAPEDWPHSSFYSRTALQKVS